MIAGIETGGTKVVLALAESGRPDTPVSAWTIPTRGPRVTVRAIIELLGDHNIEAIGLGSFGPVGVDPDDPRYGVLGETPKPGWSGFDQRAALGVLAPVAVVSDVQAAALGESTAPGAPASLVYATVGTGIGMGAVIDGRVPAGLGHPELGHLLIRRHPDDPFAGHCPRHRDCLEGLVAGPAIAARQAAFPGLDDEAIVADALAQFVVAIVYAHAPERIILGGGVLGRPGLREAVRRRASALIAGYLGDHPLTTPHSGYLAAPAWGSDSGVLGALALAEGHRLGAVR